MAFGRNRGRELNIVDHAGVIEINIVVSDTDIAVRGDWGHPEEERFALLDSIVQ